MLVLLCATISVGTHVICFQRFVYSGVYLIPIFINCFGNSIPLQIKFIQISELSYVACNSFQYLIYIAYVPSLFSLVNVTVVPVNIDWTSLLIALHRHSSSTCINTFKTASLNRKKILDFRGWKHEIIWYKYGCWNAAKIEIFIICFIFMLHKVLFWLYISYLCYTFYYKFIINLYVHYMYFTVCYIFLFLYYWILNLSDNVFIFIV